MADLTEDQRVELVAALRLLADHHEESGAITGGKKLDDARMVVTCSVTRYAMAMFVQGLAHGGYVKEGAYQDELLQRARNLFAGRGFATDAEVREGSETHDLLS